MRLQTIFATLFCIPLTFASLSAAEHLLRPAGDAEELARKVQAGDSIVLADGTWTDADLKFERLPGSSDSPITIRPQTPGEVVFTGATEFRVSGTHVVVSGLIFRDTDKVSDVMQLRTHSERHAHHCRVTGCVFEQTADSEKGSESRWLSVYGTNNRIDHCYFAGKKSRGPTFVVWVSKDIEAHRIDHNHFGPRSELGRNGGETIRIGTSDVSEFNCRTVVEDNYFHACDGEAEAISNKSCENIYRHNVFEECSGTLTLRHGHRCVVDGNVFLGRKKSGTGGVRIIGQDHAVTNNYFEALRGDAERAAICFMNGIPNGPLNGYAPVRNALVANNTFIDCKVSVEIGVGAGKKQTSDPRDCRITHNAFAPDKWELARIHTDVSGIHWAANLHQSGKSRRQPVDIERRDLQLSKTNQRLFRPVSHENIRAAVPSDVRRDLDGYLRTDAALVGCDDPRTPQRRFVSASTTGPEWRDSQ